MLYKKLTQIFLTLILKLKVTKFFFGKPNYDFIYVGSVHERSILKDKKDIEHGKLEKSSLYFEKVAPFCYKAQKSQVYFSMV